MNAELANLIKLAAHARASLKNGGSFAPRDGYAQMRFVANDALIADNSEDWLLFIKNRGASELRLEFLSFYTFGVLSLGAQTEFWQSLLKASGQSWYIEYTLGPMPRPFEPAIDSVQVATDYLRKTLEEALVFAKTQNIGPFDTNFRASLDILDAANYAAYNYPPVETAKVPEPQQRLLRAAHRSWVFEGARGSVQDIEFTDKQVDDTWWHVASEVKQACYQAIWVGVNF